MTEHFFFDLHHVRHEPVGTSQRTLAGRPTYLATWASPWKTVVGEATPLAGFGADDATAACAALSAISTASLLESSARVVHLYEEGRVLAAEDDTWSELLAVTSASARFCLETLVVQAASAACNVPVWRLLAPSLVASTLPQSAVLDPLSDGDWGDFEREVARGVRTFKIKCGRQSATEARYLREVLDRYEDVSVRLDPNSAWNVREAEAFLLPWVGQERIEWIEDPTPDPSDWSRLRESTGHVLALDQPLSEGFGIVTRMNVDFDVLILKPMALGGFARCFQLARLGQQQNKRIVISHLFDGPVALDACIQLAFAIQSPDVAPGLGEHAALAGYASANLGKSALLEGARMTVKSPT